MDFSTTVIKEKNKTLQNRSQQKFAQPVGKKPVGRPRSVGAKVAAEKPIQGVS